MVHHKKRKLGRGVAIVGAGMSKFGVRNGINGRELFVEAFNAMKASVDKGINPNDIEGVWVGNCGAEMWESQAVIGILCADWVGLTPVSARKIEAACASSSVAVRDAIMAVASGMYDVVVAGGTEKMTTLTANETTMALAAGSDTVYEACGGVTFPGLYASMATAHMHQYGSTLEDFMKVGIKNHQNGALNPKAHFGSSIAGIIESRIAKAKDKGLPVPTWKTEMDFLNDPKANPVIAWPMRLFDCSPVTDGASCLLVVAEDIAKNFTDAPIHVIGSAHASGRALHNRDTLTAVPSAQLAAQQAYEMAGVTAQDIKIAEVHDCFTIAEIMAIGDLGFFEPGLEAARAAGDGKTARDGIKPINTSGGLKSKGHPVGASGGAQMVELFHQMRGEAGPRQVPNMDVNLALSHNVGAHGTTAVVQIYERR